MGMYVRSYTKPQSAPIMGRAKEGSCCSEGFCLRPSISLFNGDSEDPYAIAEGPSLFGGFLQCCVSAEVPVSKIEDLSRHRKSCQGALDIGDLAMIQKVRPQDCCGLLREMCTGNYVHPSFGIFYACNFMMGLL